MTATAINQAAKTSALCSSMQHFSHLSVIPHLLKQPPHCILNLSTMTVTLLEHIYRMF